jgi:hypothetical protein
VIHLIQLTERFNMKDTLFIILLALLLIPVICAALSWDLLKKLTWYFLSAVVGLFFIIIMIPIIIWAAIVDHLKLL